MIKSKDNNFHQGAICLSDMIGLQGWLLPTFSSPLWPPPFNAWVEKRNPGRNTLSFGEGDLNSIPLFQLRVKWPVLINFNVWYDHKGYVQLSRAHETRMIPVRPVLLPGAFCALQIQALARLWVDYLGLEKINSYKSEVRTKVYYGTLKWCSKLLQGHSTAAYVKQFSSFSSTTTADAPRSDKTQSPTQLTDTIIRYNFQEHVSATLTLQTCTLPITGDVQKENVIEDILKIGHGTCAVELDLMEPYDPEKRPK